MRRSLRGLRWSAFVAVASYAACSGPAPRQPDPTPGRGKPHVTFVVLDNVRADHLSLCGYERPTSPVLERLVARGARSECRAYAPADWTLPSHASFFTGAEVPVHGAHSSLRSPPLFRWGGFAFPLDSRLPTLAEQMADRGYETILVSGNPVVSEVTGLDRGFRIVRSAPAFGDWYGDALTAQLREALAARDRDRPLFVFVNVADAHTPWHSIPADVGWLPPRQGLRYQVSTGSVWAQYANGDLDAALTKALLDGYRDVYDYGIARADATFGGVLQAIGEEGLLRAEDRLVVTSDHGELLGEHQAVGHCCAVYEGLARVPVVVLGPAVDLPSPMAALDVYFLTRDGTLPRQPTPIRAVAGPSRTWMAVSDRFGGHWWVAAWNASRKSVWKDGVTVPSDLPVLGSSEGVPLDQAVEGPHAEFLVEVEESFDRVPEADRTLDERLRALGYVGGE